ncbi:voltage-gated sodium channel [Halalkalibacillus sediminis]|uniref:Voltage-gated sodium channel n=1 Tax=Halalkalibacillus sediminis TaxID=2018042 RepID=A0A2I0QSD8_9BACI|nr:ion transporter [Halalkalibacillus sediminis]PKR77246.1 voltage-gated sodium channel [Halalkalibacillus sediminis]
MNNIRDKAHRYVYTPAFQNFIITLIIINAILIGVETYGDLYARYTEWFLLADQIILWIFAIEIGMKLVAAQPTKSFFSDGWNVFDFIIVAAGFVFVGSAFVTVLRILRVLRVFRTISVIPSLRKLVNALLLTLPSLGTILLLLFIVFYIFSVIGTILFKDINAEYFGTLQDTALTLFQMITLESWASGVMRPILVEAPWGWVYFVTFILIGTFVVLNLFVGVIVNNFEKVDELENGGANEDLLKNEVSELRREIQELKDIIKENQHSNK